MSRTERKPIEDAEFTSEIDLQAANAPTVQAERELDEIRSAFGEDQRNTTLLIGKRLGRKEMRDAIAKFVTITDLIDLQKIKETKQYKGFTHFDGEKLVTITSFAEYCVYVEGRSMEAVNLDLLNLKTFGEEFFDAMQRIGIGPSTMRDLRALPEDHRQALLQAAQDGDKDVFIDMASALITKHQREKEKSAIEIADLKGNLGAMEARLKKKDDDINKLDHELERLRLDRPQGAHVNWPDSFRTGYFEQLAVTRKNIKHALGSLDLIRQDAMKIEPGSEAEEASLNQAKEVLAAELVSIHNECAEMLEALGMSFDRTLGAFSDARIRWLAQP